jgi:hypothetical protein
VKHESGTPRSAHFTISAFSGDHLSVLLQYCLRTSPFPSHSILQLYYVSLSRFFSFFFLADLEGGNKCRGTRRRVNRVSNKTGSCAGLCFDACRGNEEECDEGLPRGTSKDHDSRASCKNDPDNEGRRKRQPGSWNLADFDNLIHPLPAWRGERHFITDTFSHQCPAQG